MVVRHKIPLLNCIISSVLLLLWVVIKTYCSCPTIWNGHEHIYFLGNQIAENIPLLIIAVIGKGYIRFLSGGLLVLCLLKTADEIAHLNLKAHYFDYISTIFIITASLYGLYRWKNSNKT